MVIFGLLGFMFGLIALGEANALKKRVAALEAAAGAGPQ